MVGHNSVKLVVAPAAQSDIAGIFSYTIEKWGENQAQKYLISIRKAFQRLREQPLKGNVRTELNPNIRSIVVEKHIIYYRQQDKTLEIVRILHGRQDPSMKIGKNV